MVEALIDPCASFEYSSVKKESTFCNNLMQKSNLLHFYFKVLLYTVIALTQHKALTRFRAKKILCPFLRDTVDKTHLRHCCRKKSSEKNNCKNLSLYENLSDKR